jgi:hypothetical protein
MLEARASPSDLGVSVAPEFVEMIHEHQPDIVGFSGFLTTTMPMFKANINALRGRHPRRRDRDGRRAATQKADAVGADGCAPDTSTAVRLAKDRSAAVGCPSMKPLAVIEAAVKPVFGCQMCGRCPHRPA